jgi:excisionase family DNA binding protein
VNVGEFAGFGNPIPLQAKSEGNPMTDTHGEILTLEEVAAYLKAGKRTVYRLAQKGEIPAFKLGGTWRFRRSELDSWIGEKKRPEAE